MDVVSGYISAQCCITIYRYNVAPLKHTNFKFDGLTLRVKHLKQCILWYLLINNLSLYTSQIGFQTSCLFFFCKIWQLMPPKTWNKGAPRKPMQKSFFVDSNKCYCQEIYHRIVMCPVIWILYLLNWTRLSKIDWSMTKWISVWTIVFSVCIWNIVSMLTNKQSIDIYGYSYDNQQFNSYWINIKCPLSHRTGPNFELTYIGSCNLGRSPSILFTSEFVHLRKTYRLTVRHTIMPL